MRLFAAVVPPPVVLDHLAAALGQVLAPPTGQRDPLLPRQTWHVTLAFFGEVPAGHVPELSQELADVVSRCSPFELALAGAGTFASRQAWIGLGGDVAPLKRLMGEVGGLGPGGGAPQTHRPHLTISRAVAQAGLRDQVHALTVYRGPSWTVTSVHLLESKLGQGEGRHSLYTSLAEVALAT
jgi:2'-5' RNA ligase